MRKQRPPQPVDQAASSSFVPDSAAPPTAPTPSSQQPGPDVDFSFNLSPSSSWETAQFPLDPTLYPDQTFVYPTTLQNDSSYWQPFQPIPVPDPQLLQSFPPADCANLPNDSLYSTAGSVPSTALTTVPWEDQYANLNYAPQPFYNSVDASTISSISQSPEQAQIPPGSQQWPTLFEHSPAQMQTHTVTYDLPQRSVQQAAQSVSIPVIAQQSGPAPGLQRHRIRPPVAATPRNKTNAGVKHAHPSKKEVSRAVQRAFKGSAAAETGEGEIPACWRCRRYKKQCDGPGECSNCMKGNFRVWPESLGCRRGCLEDLIIEVIPEGASIILTKAAGSQPLTPSWRAQPNFNRKAMIEHRLPSSDRLQRLSLKVQSIGMYGDEFISLFNIIARYQNFQKKQSAVLDAAIEVLDSTCDIYHNFVVNDWPLEPTSIQKATTLCSFQFHRLGKTFVASALSGRRADWLPSFLSMCLGINAVIIMIDTAKALPPTWQHLLYPNIIRTAQFMRETFYPVISDLLRAGTNGSKPFEMSCWSYIPDPTTGVMVRNPNGMKLVADDEPTFDGMKALQEWYQQNSGIGSLGSRWANAQPFSDPNAPSIMAMLGLFRYSARLA